MRAASSVIVRPFRSGDEAPLAELYLRSIGRRIEEDHWRGKLRARHSAADNVWLVEGEDGRPIFHYAGIPTRFRCSPVELDAMVAVEAMTAPECRRRGILTQAVQQINANWRNAGIAFVLGLPNDQWGSRIRALGWQTLFPLQWLLRPLRPEVLLARRLRCPPLARTSVLGEAWNRRLQRRAARDESVSVESMERADAAFDSIWERCKSDSMFSCVRDRTWIDARFFAATDRKYTVMLARRDGVPVGYAAHSHQHSRAVLADILAPRADAQARDALLHELIERLMGSGTESLATLAVPGTEHFRWLRRAGFLPRRCFSVELIPLAADLPVQSLRHAGNWRLSGADFDVV